MKKLILLVTVSLASLSLFFGGCTTPKNNPFDFALKTKVHSNNKNLLFLKLGMTKDDVYKVMGTPDSSEGYEWGTAWIYRTGASNSITFKGAMDENFTPVVFDRDDKLIGWGRQVFLQKNPS